ncbi:hypothetical protein FBUS_00794 [Fasciolopsis buskii]|uniref:Integrase catalytic domain-containing protein n=1 Tax=Fasciolopsis buskii TaxID=27845 RepID=A0A8E0RX77_9TREM|nr:hypothetical protein FBUS_00794 [Fasciolopsis buski]
MDCALARGFWGPQQRCNIINFCNRCAHYIRTQLPIKYDRTPLQPVVIGYLSQLVRMDIVGSLPETTKGNRYLWLMIAYFTKWCEAVASPSADAVSNTKAIFDHRIANRGTPERLHSDRGTCFENAAVA